MLIWDKMKSFFKKKGVKTVTIFSFPHAQNEQLDVLLKDVEKFGKSTDDVIFTTTDLRDGALVHVKVSRGRKR